MQIKIYLKANMIKNRPGGVYFTSGFSREIAHGGKQTTVGQMIEDRIIMMISNAMINI